MHELAVCQSLIDQAVATALAHGADKVTRIKIAIGPLSGVEEPLLRRAYSIARGGTLADEAELEIETLPVIARCRDCGTMSEVAVNRLVCGGCGTWRVEIVSGEEMLLKSVELANLPSPPARQDGTQNEGSANTSQKPPQKPPEKPQETRHV